MFNGSTGFIEFFFEGQEYPAADKYFTYSSLNQEIYEPLKQATKREYIKLQPNTFEKNVGSWLEENFIVKSSANILIEFTFDNIQVIGIDEVEFDIMAKSNEEGIKFAASDVYISYSEDAFGSNVVTNDKIEVNKETIIENNVYTLEVTDDTAQIVKVLVNAGLEPNELYPLSAVAEKFLHVKLDIESIVNLASLSFEDFLMANQSFFYDETTGEFIGFDKIAVENPIFPFLACNIDNDFGPNPVAAGTGDILTINGNNFGNDVGIVRFPNANDGGMTMMQALPEDIIGWNNDQIMVRVPSIQNSTFPAGSGIFEVETTMGMQCQSPLDLDIRYAVLNFRQNVSIGNAVRVYLSDINNLGQYIFHINNDLAAMGDEGNEGRMITETALCDWNMATDVNWMLGDNTAINQALIDNVNVITMAPVDAFIGDQADATAYTAITGNRIGSCQTLPPNPDVFAFVTDVDIIIRQNLNDLVPPIVGGWFFDEMGNPAANQMDYYSVVSHELGHAHNLRHAIPDEKIMFWQLLPGVTRRVINADDEAGGEEILNASLILNNGINCMSPVVTNPGLCMVNVKDIHLNPKDIGLSISPNPIILNEIQINS